MQIGNAIALGSYSSLVSVGLAEVQSFDLTQELPTGMTVSRTSEVLVRDNTGELQVVASNTAAYDHDASGNALGLLIEEGRTNLCTNKNYSPADTSGYTTTGTATVSRVYDPTSLSAAGLDTVSSGGYVIHLSGGASGGTVAINGTTGATGAFSASMFAKHVAGAAAYFGITPDASAVQITGSTMTRHKAENLTATATTDQIVFTLGAFASVRFVLNQLEAGVQCTSPIRVNGATAARAKAFLQDTALDTRTYWDAEKGGILMEVQPYSEQGIANTWGLFVAGSSEDAFPDDAYYLQMNQTSTKVQGYGKAATVSYTGSVTATLLKDRVNPVSLSWTNGNNIRVQSGAGVSKEITMSTALSNVDTLTLGAFASNAWQFNGHIKSMSFFYGAQPTRNQIAENSFSASDKAIVGGGQSNMENITAAVAADGYNNNGERAFVDVLDDIWGTSTRNWLLNGAIGGTFITSWRGAGDSITKWKNHVNAFIAGGGSIEAIVWDQGESDMGVTKENFKLYYKEIFDDMRATVGSVPVVIIPLGKYALANTQTHYDNCRAHREAYEELASENAWIHLGPEKSFRPLQSGDNVHLDDYTDHARAVARKVLDVLGETITGGVDGPTITGAVRTGTSVAVTIAHDAGTDFTPTTAIEGFTFYDDGVEIPITAAVRTNATTITLTLNSTPTGVEVLDYARGHLYSVDQTKLVRDNDTYPLALRSTRITL